MKNNEIKKPKGIMVDGSIKVIGIYGSKDRNNLLKHYAVFCTLNEDYELRTFLPGMHGLFDLRTNLFYLFIDKKEKK